MANTVSWKGLYRGGGGGSGASFTRKVIKPNTPMPYKVGAFEKLVIPVMPTKVTLDLSGLKPDDAFQVFDAGRNFEQNPVLIPATTKIEIADAGSDVDPTTQAKTHRDLSLDMVGAGQVWEFVLVQPDEDKPDEFILVASDSPGYLGTVGGGGGSAPAPAPTPGTAVVAETDAIVVYSNIDPGHQDFVAPPGIGGQRDVILINPSKAAYTIWVWPKGTTTPVEMDIVDRPTIEKEFQMRAPFRIGADDPAQSPVDFAIANPRYISDALYMNQATGDLFRWPKEHLISQGSTNYWEKINIGGGGGGGGALKWVFKSFDMQATDKPRIDVKCGEFWRINFATPIIAVGTPQVFLPNLNDPAMKDDDRKPIRILRTGFTPPSIADEEIDASAWVGKDDSNPTTIWGDWDDFDPAKGDTAFFLDTEGEFVELTPVKWDNDIWHWFISIAGYNQQDSQKRDMSKDARDKSVDVRPGETVLVRTANPVTLPFPTEEDPQPITIIFAPLNTGATTPEDGAFINMPVATDADVRTKYFKGYVGAWEGKMHYRETTQIVLEQPGAWIRFEQCGAGEETFWLITGGSRCYPNIPIGALPEEVRKLIPGS